MELRFVVDVNVGRLAKWLRVMGYDALFIPDVDDGELLRVAREQGRIVLTRDRYILERRPVTQGQVRVVLVTSDDFRKQIQQLAEELGLHSHNGFTLCVECNEPLQSVSKRQVEDRVPPYVFNAQEQFYECPRCGKLYWRGTHWRNMRAELAEMMKGA
jgi:hypothetical protein